MLFEKSEHLQQFAAYMNKQHPNIRFSKEAEKNVLTFLHAKIYKESGNSVSSVYGKVTSINVNTSFYQLHFT